MEIPHLEIREKDRRRTREFNQYSQEQKAAMVKAFIIGGSNHREIDRDVLHLDPKYSRGFQSMSVLHYLGLRKPFSGLFDGKTVSRTIDILKNADPDEFCELIELLELKSPSILEVDELKNDIWAETTDSYPVHKDGAKTEYYTNRYERNPANRKEAIRIHGTTCMACGFNFEETYGEIGKNYIEVHHVTPLFSLDGEIDIDPAKDLVVVCSNCHRMIHRNKDRVLTVQELKEYLKKISGTLLVVK